MFNIKKYKKNVFLKSILMITGGTVLAQIINTILSPIITRLYSPDTFGIFTVYTSIIGMIAIVGSYKYEMAITIADNNKNAVRVYLVSVISLIFNVSIITIIMYFWGRTILSYFKWDDLYNYIYFIPIGVFLIGMYNISKQWALRKKEFKNISKTILNQSITQNLMKISAGIFTNGATGLIFGQILGQCVGIFTLSKSLFKEKVVFKTVKRKDLVLVAKRYKHFPIYFAPSQLLNASGIHLPIFFITYLFGSAITGIFGLANTIINLPFNLIGRSVSDVFYAEAASIGKTDPLKLKNLSQKLFIRLSLIGLVPLMVVMLIGPTLFSIVFGEEWGQAGVFARYIAILVYARFIFMPISRVFEVFEKQKEALYIDVSRAILVIGSFVISKMFLFSVDVTILIYSIVMTLVYFITFLVARGILNQQIINSITTNKTI